MLHRLEIENFYSIRDPQVIDLRTGSAGSDAVGRLGPIWKGAAEVAPKVVALFGANASGKSNVLKALAFLEWFVTDSFSAPRGSRPPIERFNEVEMLGAPTRLAIHLGGVEDIGRVGDPEAAECGYVYEVELIAGSAPTVRESLRYRPTGASRRVTLFERRADGSVTAAKAFGLAGYRQALKKILRPDASAIATLAQLDHPYAKAMSDLASCVRGNILVEKKEPSDDQIIDFYAIHPFYLMMLNREIERIDLGIDLIRMQPGSNGPVAAFKHHGLALPMSLRYQSQGTRQFLKLFQLIFEALSSGSIAIVDELDSAIHPLILSEILRWFHDPIRNPHDAQLWMTCQNASLLEDLVKEEVVFCNKDARGRTEIYRLVDIQAVRRTDNYYKKYLGGAFGAVPQIG